jgi:hypothetical protein
MLEIRMDLQISRISHFVGIGVPDGPLTHPVSFLFVESKTSLPLEGKVARHATDEVERDESN